MPNPHMETYLNDHLAGSVVALELLADLEKTHPGELQRFFAELRQDIEADRDELVALMQRLGVGVGRTRRVAAWLAEKAAELKLRLDDKAGGNFRLFESSELISLGIEGKATLWRTLAALARTMPDYCLADYQRLEQRALEQRSRLERVRLEAARASFARP
jgi:hypothetical protein